MRNAVKKKAKLALAAKIASKPTFHVVYNGPVSARSRAEIILTGNFGKEECLNLIEILTLQAEWLSKTDKPPPPLERHIARFRQIQATGAGAIEKSPLVIKEPRA